MIASILLSLVLLVAGVHEASACLCAGGSTVADDFGRAAVVVRARKLRVEPMAVTPPPPGELLAVARGTWAVFRIRKTYKGGDLTKGRTIRVRQLTFAGCEPVLVGDPGTDFLLFLAELPGPQRGEGPKEENTMQAMPCSRSRAGRAAGEDTRVVERLSKRKRGRSD